MPDDDGVCGMITICAGPPICLLMGDEAVAAGDHGCPWCRRITVFEDGSEHEMGPHVT